MTIYSTSNTKEGIVYMVDVDGIVKTIWNRWLGEDKIGKMSLCGWFMIDDFVKRNLHYRYRQAARDLRRPLVRRIITSAVTSASNGFPHKSKLSFGIIWYLWYVLVSFGTFWYNMVPFRYRLVTFGIVWYLLLSFGNFWYLF